MLARKIHVAHVENRTNRTNNVRKSNVLRAETGEGPDTTMIIRVKNGVFRNVSDEMSSRAYGEPVSTFIP